MIQYTDASPKSEIIFCQSFTMTEDVINALTRLNHWFGRAGKWARVVNRDIEITVYDPDTVALGQKRYMKLMRRSFNGRTKLRLLILTRAIAEVPANIDSILSIPNLTVRALVLSAIGKGIFLSQNVELNERGRALIRAGRFNVLVVECPSTKERTCLFVPGGISSPEEAVAWTFGLSHSEWKPQIET